MTATMIIVIMRPTQAVITIGAVCIEKMYVNFYYLPGSRSNSIVGGSMSEPLVSELVKAKLLIVVCHMPQNFFHN